MRKNYQIADEIMRNIYDDIVYNPIILVDD